MFQAKHNDDQTEGRIYHNHDSALLVEAAYRNKQKCNNVVLKTNNRSSD